MNDKKLWMNDWNDGWINEWTGVKWMNGRMYELMDGLKNLV